MAWLAGKNASISAQKPHARGVTNGKSHPGKQTTGSSASGITRTKCTRTSSSPSNIKIHDITLRDGEQQTGIILSKDDKIRIAEALAEAGVHRIEAGMPIVSPSDAEAIKEIVKRNLGPQIFSLLRAA